MSKPQPIKFTFPGQQQYRMCGIKRKYSTKKEAEQHKGHRVYLCPYCDCWHRTSKK